LAILVEREAIERLGKIHGSEEMRVGRRGLVVVLEVPLDGDRHVIVEAIKVETREHPITTTPLTGEVENLEWKKNNVDV
jgi:hypothetical protein